MRLSDCQLSRFCDQL
uniref:BLTX125 n=1 Tax=Nephila pilipes TaxID=299642 RepID=A0A076KVI4_NEPPI|nr:BLTX125 [Nephila pilipes]AII98045.1 BLTX694 [Nephila pilipes]AII98072.1 BLTX736 [Nephila pilipes]AII98081.1 BLTX746 [Nephila pilipes]AII98088.1 BLTX753 [Nephila pilipes]